MVPMDHLDERINDGMDWSAGDLRFVVSGRDLRRLLTLYLKAAGELTVAQLVGRLEADGYAVDGRPSKVVSDALRWEIRWRRVTRIGRGRYRFGRIPRSTEYRMRKGLAHLHAKFEWYSSRRR